MGTRVRGAYAAGLLALALVAGGCGQSSSVGSAPEEPSARDRDMALAAETVAQDHGIEVDQALEQLRAQDELHDVDTSWDPGFLEVYSLYGPEYGVRWVTRTDGIEDQVRAAVDGPVGIDFELDYAVVTLDLHDLKEAARRVRDSVPEFGDYSSSLDLATGTIVFYTSTPPDQDIADAVEQAAAPALVRWEEGESVAY